MFNVRKSIMCVAVGLGLLQPSSAHSALLEGRMIAFTLMHKDSVDSPETGTGGAPATVGPGLEYDNLGSTIEFPQRSVILDIDVSDAQIVITAVNDQPFSFKEQLMFDVLPPFHPHVSSIKLNPATNWAGYMQTPPVSNNRTFTVSLSLLSGLAGQQIVFDVVPEPAGATIAAGLALRLVVLRRRRSVFLG